MQEVRERISLEGSVKAEATTADRKGRRRMRRGLDAALSLVMILLVTPVAWRSFVAPEKRFDGLLVPTQSLNVSGAEATGAETARVILIEYSDFQCPFCGMFARDVLPRIRREYIATGKVRLVFREFPLSFHHDAAAAAKSAVCAGEQGQFWEMHDLLFADQSQLDETGIDDRVARLGLDGARFRACVATRAAILVRRDLAAGKAIGISGTPAFLIGSLDGTGHVRVVRAFVGARPFEDFVKALDGQLAASEGNRR